MAAILFTSTWVPNATQARHLTCARRSGRGLYDGQMAASKLSGGAVHDLPADLEQGLRHSEVATHAWGDITPLARNEFICWVEDAKRDATRERRIRRTVEELEDGMRRPCCWPGCSHRERNGR